MEKIISLPAAICAVAASLLVACTNGPAAPGSTSIASSDNLARTPPMGWNSWNVFGKKMNEKAIRETADAIVNTGLKDAGFEYVVLDDFWQGGETPIQACFTRIL